MEFSKPRRSPMSVQLERTPRRSTDRLARLVVALSTLATLAAGQDVLTSRNDQARSGVQSRETILTPATVKTRFKFLRSLSVDGQVYAQPLYVSAAHLDINGALHGNK